MFPAPPFATDSYLRHQYVQRRNKAYPGWQNLRFCGDVRHLFPQQIVGDYNAPQLPPQENGFLV
ncbi:hypothetical protein BMD97_22340 [Klebsiella pneumoniae]|nr:hypothetical protein BMD97_22340 [Klebsiella pneumoniae]VGD50826.1 Uncharacterised protein [Klebsiella pneumoniae]VGE67281.1 Uncharacterised protein [Klebsiella pneumoniae]VGQ03384.1 hypothetical protein SB00098_05463 [Klebsiella quasipneumoniae subsp. quasipneumoniae]HBY4119727.1 hypothetical protein [Klebsiella pneumoniae]